MCFPQELVESKTEQEGQWIVVIQEVDTNMTQNKCCLVPAKCVNKKKTLFVCLAKKVQLMHN